MDPSSQNITNNKPISSFQSGGTVQSLKINGEEARVDELKSIVEKTNYQGDPQTIQKLKNIIKLEKLIDGFLINDDSSDSREFIKKASKDVLDNVIIEMQSELIDQAIKMMGHFKNFDVLPFLIYFLSQHSSEEREKLLDNLIKNFSYDGGIIYDDIFPIFELSPQDRLLVTALPSDLMGKFVNKINKIDIFKGYAFFIPFFHLLPNEYKTKEKVQEIVDGESPLEYLKDIKGSKPIRNDTIVPPALYSKNENLFSLDKQVAEPLGKL